MTELYANRFRAILASPMLVGDDHAHVNMAAPAALQGGQFRVICDAEIMLVTAGETTTTWTVTRGIEGTTAAAHAGGVTVAHVLTAAGLLNASVVNVRTYGATGDGVTDDTAAVQAALNALAPAVGGVESLYFPPGSYLISDTLTIPHIQHRRIFGAANDVSSIEMTVDNKPILRSIYTDTHSIMLESITLRYATAQGSANTRAVALEFRGGDDGTVDVSFYFWTVRNLTIYNACYGVMITGTATITLWGCLFDSVRFFATSVSALYLSSPVVSGMPDMIFRSICIFNSNTSVVSTGDAVYLRAVEATFTGLDIEGWYNRVMYVVSNYVNVVGLHVEGHQVTAAYPKIVEVADSILTLTGSSFSMSAEGTVSLATLLNTNAGATIIVNGLIAQATGGRSFTGCAGSGRIFLTGCLWPSGIGEYYSSGYGAGLYARVLVDGCPPTVDTLPAGAEIYRGRRFRVLGGAGVADVVSECSKNAADAYVWVTK